MFTRSRVTVLKFVVIGNNSVIACESVVARSVSTDWIVRWSAIAAYPSCSRYPLMGAITTPIAQRVHVSLTQNFYMIEPEPTSLPFISVILCTYNSASTVQETLDSLTWQEYPAMEVLVCDDGSTDSTPAIVRAWLECNKHLFKRAVLFQSSVNEGVCKNVRKGYAAAKGDWFKPIAGDDLLEPQAMRAFGLLAAGTELDVIVSLVKTFGDDKCDAGVLPSTKDLMLITGSSERLRFELRTRNPIPAPGVLIRRISYELVGGVDCTFRHLDDWPLWVRFVEAGKSFGVLEETLVRYRVSTASISTCRLATTINIDYIQDLVTFYLKHQRRFLSPVRRWDRSIEIFRWKLAIRLLRPYPNLYKCTRLLHALSPCAWGNLLQRWK